MIWVNHFLSQSYVSANLCWELRPTTDTDDLLGDGYSSVVETGYRDGSVIWPPHCNMTKWSKRHQKTSRDTTFSRTWKARGCFPWGHTSVTFFVLDRTHEWKQVGSPVFFHRSGLCLRMDGNLKWTACWPYNSMLCKVNLMHLDLSENGVPQIWWLVTVFIRFPSKNSHELGAVYPVFRHPILPLTACFQVVVFRGHLEGTTELWPPFTSYRECWTNNWKRGKVKGLKLSWNKFLQHLQPSSKAKQIYQFYRRLSFPQAPAFRDVLLTRHAELKAQSSDFWTCRTCVELQGKHCPSTGMGQNGPQHGMVNTSYIFLSHQMWLPNPKTFNP